jgi:alkylated DNA repair dioxygenase AlkB
VTRPSPASQQSLFAPAGSEPFAQGFVYEAEFVSREEEAALLEHIRHLPLTEAEYKQFRAKRRIVSYGGRYDFSANELQPGEPIPAFLHPLRARAAAWAGRPAEEYTHALIAEYSPGTPLGWHRDVPNFERILGISLHGPARMRVRRYPPKPRERSLAIELAPRSIYRLEGEARWDWQHSIPPTHVLRYSITFRSLRQPGAR